MDTNGKLYMWGRSDVGQVGLPKDKVTIDDHGYVMKRPHLVEFFNAKSVQSVALGEAHTLVLDSHGKVYSFGWGELG